MFSLFLINIFFLPQSSNGVLTDFLSFYTLPSTVMHHPVHKSLKAAYSFYNVHTETPLLDLMNDALIIAKMVSSSVFCSVLLPMKKENEAWFNSFFTKKTLARW